MLSYDDIYETLRKEKYSEALQVLPKDFVEGFTKFINEKREDKTENEMFSGIFESRKEIENALAMFKELMLRRKKKLLNLVFVAAETGIMKRDYENMLGFERELFENLVKAVENGDKELAKMLHGKKSLKGEEGYKLLLFSQDVEEFVDMDGNLIGPFNSGELVNINAQVAGILVDGGKATYVDE